MTPFDSEWAHMTAKDPILLWMTPFDFKWHQLTSYETIKQMTQITKWPHLLMDYPYMYLLLMNPGWPVLTPFDFKLTQLTQS